MQHTNTSSIERRLDHESILLRSGRAVAHARSGRRLYALLKRGTQTPSNAVEIPADSLFHKKSEAALRGEGKVKRDRLNARSAMPWSESL